MGRVYSHISLCILPEYPSLYTSFILIPNECVNLCFTVTRLTFAPKIWHLQRHLDASTTGLYQVALLVNINKSNHHFFVSKTESVPLDP